MIARDHPHRRRGAALILSFAVHGLIILFLAQAANIHVVPRPHDLVTVNLIDLPDPPRPPEVQVVEDVARPRPKPAPPAPAAPAAQKQVAALPNPEPRPAVAPPILPAPAPIVPMPASPAPSPTAAAPYAGASRFAGNANGADQGDGRTLTLADWIRRPTSADWAAYYPATAWSFRGTAQVTLSCKVTRSNRVQYCRVVGEKPRGFGLGQAAVAMSAKFRVRPVQVNGQARYDLRVRIPLVLAAPRSGG